MTVWLEGAIVQKVERLAKEAVLLSVRTPGRTVFLLVLGGREPVIGEIARPPVRAAGKAADAPLMRMRRLFEGARVIDVRRRGDAKTAWARIAFRRGEEHPAIIVTRDALTVLEQVSEPTDDDVVVHEADAAPLGEEAERAWSAHLARAREERRRALASAIDGARKKLRRRIEAIDGDLAKIGGADAWQMQATLLIANAYAVKRGATSVTLDDWSSGEARPITIALDPSKSAKENADALFHRSKRLKKGRAVAEGRRAETERALDALDRLRAEVDQADERALDVLTARAKAAGIRVAQPEAGKRREQEERKPFHAYRSGEREVLVGRGAKDNDTLTTKIAKPHDLWLHAKGWTGSHVIVPMAKNESPSPDLLIDAAHLAAHFSDARGEQVVEVQWTPRRYVRKPKGSAPGAVVIDREKVIVLRVEPQRVERLIATKRE